MALLTPVYSPHCLSFDKIFPYITNDIFQPSEGLVVSFLRLYLVFLDEAFIIILDIKLPYIWIAQKDISVGFAPEEITVSLPCVLELQFFRSFLKKLRSFHVFEASQFWYKEASVGFIWVVCL